MHSAKSRRAPRCICASAIFKLVGDLVRIAAAVAKASREHKRVIIDFGGDWCPDCQILDIYFHQQPNADLLARHFVLVHVDIGQMDHNVDVAAKYQVPLEAALGGPETMYPEFRDKIKDKFKLPAKCPKNCANAGAN